MTQYHIFLFDLDGTLLDTLPDIEWALNTARGHYGQGPIDRARVRRFVGNGLGELVRHSLGLPLRVAGETATGETTIGETSASAERETLARAITGKLKELYADVPFRHTKPYDGISDLLAKLRALPGVKLAVITNKARSVADATVRHFFPGIFDLVYGESHDRPRKPDPQTVRLTLESLGGSGDPAADRAVFIGDSDVDIRTAVAASCPHVACLWGFRDRADLEKSGARVYAQTVADLEALLLVGGKTPVQ